MTNSPVTIDDHMASGSASDTNSPLRRSELLSYGIADYFQTAAVQFVSLYLLFFYTDILALSAAVVGGIFAFSRIWDAINDPLMGIIIDKTHTRFGRCRPYLIPGSIVLASALIMAFSKVSFEGLSLLIYVIVCYNLFNMAYTATNLPLTAQLPLMTTNKQERVRLSATRAFFQSIAYASLPLIAEPLLLSFGGHRDPSAYMGLAVAIGILCIISFILMFNLTQERVTVASQRLNLAAFKEIFLGQIDWLILLFANILISIALVSRISSGIYYFTYVLNDMQWFGTFMALSTLSMIPCSLCAHHFAIKIGKRNFAIAGCAVGIVGNIILLIMPTDPVWILIGGMLGGCAVGAFVSVLFAMEGDIADRVEKRTGIRAQAMVCAAVALGYKVALGIGTAVVGWLLGSAGYVPNSVDQSIEVIQAISMGFSWIPLITVIIGMGILVFYSDTNA